jgi:hypothetical protein
LRQCKILFFFFFFFFYLEGIGTLVCTGSELILKFEFYREIVALFGRGDQPVAKTLPTQDNTDIN